MRKATWGILLLAVFSLTFGSPVRESPFHGILSLAGLGAFIVLSLFPPLADRRYRTFLYAAVGCSLASFLLVVSGATANPILAVLARLLAVATVTLPLWLIAGPAQFAFVAAGAIALVTGIPAVAAAGPYVTSLHAYGAALACLWVAARWEGWLAPTEKKAKRVVVASNIRTITPEERARRLERIEARYRAGEIPEHKYWDLRQELESR